MKIRSKLIVYFLVISLIPLIIIGIFNYISAEQLLKKEILNKLENIATLGEKNTEDEIEENLEKIKLISTNLQLNIELDKYNNNIDRNKSQVSMNNIINPIKSAIKDFDDISIRDLTGTIVASTNKSAIGKNHANDKLFIQGKKLQNDVSIFFNDKNNKINLYVGSPIIYNDKLIGLVTAIYNLDNLLSIFQTYEGLGKTGEFILAHKNDNGNGVLFTPLRFDSITTFNLNVSKDQINAPTIQSLLKNEKTFTDTLDYRGIPVLAVTRYLEGIDWGLVAKIDKSEAFTPLENLKYVTIINGILVGIMVIIASLIIGKSISNPIHKLMAASKNISQGKFDNPISIIGGSEEIKELSNQLDNMRQNIHYTNNHLNDLVDERTQKLEKAIVELKDNQEALNKSNKNLLLVNDKLSLQGKSQMEFINITAHELRTPIVPIITLTELLYSIIKKENETQKKNPSKENEKKQEFLQVILRNCYRLYRITEDILDITKIESQNLKLNKEMIQLSEVIGNVVNDFNEIINKKRYGSDQVRIVYEPSKDIIPVNADKGRLNQVFSNLLDNALKFTKEGNIIISAKKQKDDEVIVSIKDSGTGIDPEILPRLFTKFATTKSESGTGLGLYISKNIIETHGGKMWAEENPEGGSTFYFTLPIVKSDKIEESEKRI
jgi:signal transduction histidine kinase